jgi:hypothetical protein
MALTPGHSAFDMHESAVFSMSIYNSQQLCDTASNIHIVQKKILESGISVPSKEDPAPGKDR